jgi:hypothetical protein
MGLIEWVVVTVTLGLATWATVACRGRPEQIMRREGLTLVEARWAFLLLILLFGVVIGLILFWIMASIRGSL